MIEIHDPNLPLQKAESALKAEPRRGGWLPTKAKNLILNKVC
jgi:hypothetical protein